MSSPPLLFLYQTRTIFHQSSRRKCPTLLQSFSTTAASQRRLAAWRKPSAQRSSLDRETQADILPGYDPNSTLTPHEDQKFRALFEAAAKGLPPPSLQQSSVSRVGNGNEESYKVGTSLDELFREILRDTPQSASQKKRDRAKQGVVFTPDAGADTFPPSQTILRGFSKELPAALQGAWRDVRRAIAMEIQQVPSGTHTGYRHLDQPPPSTHDIALEEHKKREIAKIRLALKQAQTDSEVWAVLESEIFPQISKLVRMVKKRLAPPKKADSAISKGQAAKTTSVSDPSVVRLIQAVYPLHILATLRELRVRFPRSQYSSAVVPALKRLGPVSQVLGLSVELYNELLFISWRQHADIAQCTRILEDMNSQGLLGDRYTTAVFVDADREMKASEDPESELSPVRRVWWQLLGVREAMAQWRTIMNVIDARADEHLNHDDGWEAESRALNSDQPMMPS